jgi:hypothetical protein
MNLPVSFEGREPADWRRRLTFGLIAGYLGLHLGLGFGYIPATDFVALLVVLTPLFFFFWSE